MSLRSQTSSPLITLARRGDLKGRGLRLHLPPQRRGHKDQDYVETLFRKSWGSAQATAASTTAAATTRIRTISRDGAIIFSDLIGKLDVLRVRYRQI